MQRVAIPIATFRCLLFASMMLCLPTLALADNIDDDGDCYCEHPTLACVPRTGCTTVENGDCADDNPDRHPGATEGVGDGVDQDCDNQEICFADADEDGYRHESNEVISTDDTDCRDPGEAARSVELDCNDADATINPLAGEVPGNGIDDDCDTFELCFVDADGDGHRPDETSTVVSTDESCAESGEATDSDPVGDCDDDDPARHADATEVCDDLGVDEDCDLDSNELDAVDCVTRYLDLDGDGFGLLSDSECRCTATGSYTSTEGLGDCDDSDAYTHPGASARELSGCTRDFDGDGWGDYDPPVGVDAGTDCDDLDETVHPEATEIPGDELDQNCDDRETCFTDLDNDSYRPGAGTETISSSDMDCEDSGEASSSDPTGDCLDSSAHVFPGASPLEAGTLATACTEDADGDDYGDLAPPSGVMAGTDCDDSKAAISPGATENPGDLTDSDCDRLELCYIDADNDGYREGAGEDTLSTANIECTASGQAVATDPSGDCDDTSNLTFPGASEHETELDADACTRDSDSDGYGDREASGDIEPGTDCDDSDSGVNPSAMETWYDGIDQDCDEASDFDQDQDSFDSETHGGTDCDDLDPLVSPGAAEIWYDGHDQDCDGASDFDQDADGHESDAYGGDDCDDTDGAVHPGAAEIWYDGRDQDCSEGSDYDQDGDGQDAEGYLAGTDCDDEDPEVYRGATEIWYDGQDQDCDGWSDFDQDHDGADTVDHPGGDDCWDDPTAIPEEYRVVTGVDSEGRPLTWDQPSADEVGPEADETWYDGPDQDCAGDDDLDADGDSWRTYEYPDSEGVFGEDCDDVEESIHPEATDIIADGIDQDCDGNDLCYVDADHDDFIAFTGAVADTQALPSCSERESHLTDPDCDDLDPSINPYGVETCNGSDDDCDGSIDEGSLADAPVWYCDRDGDGFGNPDDSPVRACAVPTPGSGSPCAQYVANNEDCWDSESDPTAFCTWPGIAQNEDDLLACMKDCDNDDYGDVDDTNGNASGVDCDDGDAEIHPGVEEVCEAGGIQIDNDCDSVIYDVGDGTNSEMGAIKDFEGEDYSTKYYRDVDSDGYGSLDEIWLCGPEEGYSTSSGDCADRDASRHPGAPEICNGADEDCDETVDEPEDLDLDTSGCVDAAPDRDLDRYGSNESKDRVCLCFDGVPNPEEENHAVCDALVAEGGKYEAYNNLCWTLDATDCYDYDDTINPGAPEVYDGSDNNCDTYVPFVELDCDDDGSLLLDADTLGPTMDPDKDIDSTFLGLEPCRGLQEQTRICWNGVSVRLTCDGPSTLWMASLNSEDVAAKFIGGKRFYVKGRACTEHGDCDDTCALRCPGATELCDGIDNDCVGSELDDTSPIQQAFAGIPDAMDLNEPHPGYVSSSEMDFDGDGYVGCRGVPDPDQLWLTQAGCSSSVSENGLYGDCNDLCSLSSPGIEEERCDGFTDICGGIVEGLDGDADGHLTCGPGGSGDAADFPEDIFVPVFFLENVGAGEDSAAVMDTAVSQACDLASQKWIPLLLPRRNAPECDQRIEDALGLLLGQSVIRDATIAATLDDFDAATQPLLDLCIRAQECAEGSDAPSCAGLLEGRCGLVRITLDVSTDEEIWEDSGENYLTGLPGCEEHPEQIISRTVWSRERVLLARRLVQEWECYRLYGDYGCGDLQPPLDFVPRNQDPTSGGLFYNRFSENLLSDKTCWWKEVARFSPQIQGTGSLAGCWGDPVIDASRAYPTGGDCVDYRADVSRDAAEGPDDLVGIFWGEPAACETCLDGVDNNCNGVMDCDEPACALCFVGQGSGCADEDSPCAAGGCSSTRSSRLRTTGKVLPFVALLLLLTLLQSRRRRS